MEFKFYFFLGISIILFVTCNFPFAHAMIGLNVRRANQREFPFIVSLMHHIPGNFEPTNHFCTGSIVTRAHILTAAHCLENRLYNETQVLTESNSLTFGRIYFPRWWMTYDEWTQYRSRRPRSTNNDIAIIKLTSSMDENTPIAPINPTRAGYLYDTEVTLAGWGETNDGTLSYDLLTADVIVMSYWDCLNRLQTLTQATIILHRSLLCTIANPFVILYDGDMGGPLLADDMIVGVNKETIPFRNLHFNENKINIHTSLENYRTYLIDATRPHFDYL